MPKIKTHKGPAKVVRKVLISIETVERDLTLVRQIKID